MVENQGQEAAVESPTPPADGAQELIKEVLSTPPSSSDSAGSKPFTSPVINDVFNRTLEGADTQTRQQLTNTVNELMKANPNMPKEFAQVTALMTNPTVSKELAAVLTNPAVQKDIREMAANPIVQQQVRDMVTNPQTQEAFKKALADPAAQKAFTELVTSPQVQQTVRELVTNPQVQQTIKDIVTNPDFQKNVGDALTNPQIQQQVREFLTNPQVQQAFRDVAQDPKMQQQIREFFQNPQVQQAFKDVLTDPKVQQQVRELITNPQVQQTIRDIVTNPVVQQQIRDIVTNPAVQQQIRDIVTNPEVQKTIQQIATNPELAKTFQQIINNPELAKTFQQIVNNPDVQKTIQQIANNPEMARTFQQIINNPEVAKTFQQIISNPEVAKTFQTIINNPEVQRTFQQIINNPDVQRTFQQIVNNPEFQRTFQQIVNNPEFQKTFQQIVNNPEFQKNFNQLLNNPAMQQWQNTFKEMSQNPAIRDALAPILNPLLQNRGLEALLNPQTIKLSFTDASTLKSVTPLSLEQIRATAPKLTDVIKDLGVAKKIEAALVAQALQPKQQPAKDYTVPLAAIKRPEAALQANLLQPQRKLLDLPQNLIPTKRLEPAPILATKRTEQLTQLLQTKRIDTMPLTQQLQPKRLDAAALAAIAAMKKFEPTKDVVPTKRLDPVKDIAPTIARRLEPVATLAQNKRTESLVASQPNKRPDVINVDALKAARRNDQPLQIDRMVRNVKADNIPRIDDLRARRFDVSSDAARRAITTDGRIGRTLCLQNWQMVESMRIRQAASSVITGRELTSKLNIESIRRLGDPRAGRIQSTDNRSDIHKANEGFRQLMEDDGAVELETGDDELKRWLRMRKLWMTYDQRYLTGIELVIAALMTAAGIARVQQTEELAAGGASEESNDVLPDILIGEGLDDQTESEQEQVNLLINAFQKQVLRRKKYLLKAEDTLISIAEEKLFDTDLAWLILEINVGVLKQSWQGHNCVVEARARQTIELPTKHDMEQFRANKAAYPSVANLITVVQENEIDKELVSGALQQVIAGNNSQEATPRRRKVEQAPAF